MEGLDGHELARVLEPQWNKGLIAGSIAISFLGAFTSTQLMVQAKMSRYTAGVLVWGGLSSLIFGFCSIWSLHFVAMLACELDIPIGLNVSLTILSSILAVTFTFCALSADLLRDRYKRSVRRSKLHSRSDSIDRDSVHGVIPPPLRPFPRGPSRPLLPRAGSSRRILSEDDRSPRTIEPPSHLHWSSVPLAPTLDSGATPDRHDLADGLTSATTKTKFQDESMQALDGDDSDGSEWLSSDHSSLRRLSSGMSESDGSSYGIPKFASLNRKALMAAGTENVIRWTLESLLQGLTIGTIFKGCLWSAAITSMHYVGISSLQIPHGRIRYHPLIVALSAVISAVVCVLGTILMGNMELHIGQQVLFAIIATAGVAAMHFTGMEAVTFESSLPPSIERGYPSSLPVAIASIAITTCLVANFLLAHSATVSRNKLAEAVHTRRKMWAAIAQKENAEAVAAARSEFIASASHEIRTPLHHLVGHADLLSRTKLTDEGRLLLYAMQEATHALSMSEQRPVHLTAKITDDLTVTNSVLDWSRLENGEAACRPTALDVRAVCESIIHFLPAPDEDSTVDLMLVVKPDVPTSIFIDETYLHRIMNNLVSNACKFTGSGYVQAVLGLDDEKIVIQVTDTGEGIPEAFLPELWEPFKQAQSRGAHRGTGLGLSIVQQLLVNVSGNISVETRHKDTAGVDASTCGTTFTVEIPIQPVDEMVQPLTSPSHIVRVAVCGNPSSRHVEGICRAWSAYGVGTEVVVDAADINTSTDVVWADAGILGEDPKLREALTRLEKQRPILVPYESERALFKLFHNSVPHNVVPIKKPLVWHKIMQALADMRTTPDRGNPVGRLVRFASQVEVLESEPEAPTENQAQDEAPVVARTKTVLLVEDNKINQRMGTKMLQTLGYDVLIANDGQEGLDVLAANDAIIDAILMDQSMPVMDGLTATREIRRMEAEGLLAGGLRRPIIAVTAVVGPRAESLCREAGTDAFLDKPLSLERLKSTLDSFLLHGGLQRMGVSGDENDTLLDI